MILINFFKTYKKYILGTIIGALCIFTLVHVLVRNPKDVSITDKQVKELQIKIDSIQNKLILKDKEIDSLQKTDTILFNKIKNNDIKQIQNNLELNNLKKQYHEKINSVSHYNVSDIDSFITKRYGYINNHP